LINVQTADDGSVDACNLYIRGLGPEITGEDLQAMFEVRSSALTLCLPNRA